jgi:hypothetical protein
MKTRRLLPLLAVGIVISGLVVACSWTPWRKPVAQTAPSRDRLKLVWVSLDGFQPEALRPWLSKMSTHHRRGIQWLIDSARGNSSVKVVSPTITAPSHISTLTCVGSGEHGIMDNSMWTGTEMVVGFNRKYAPQNWVTALRDQGLRVGVAMYPSIDATADDRKADVGSFYDNPGSSPQILSFDGTLKSLAFTVPSRSGDQAPYQMEFQRGTDGSVSVVTPWGVVGPLELAKPVDVLFTANIGGVERRAGISFMALTRDAAFDSIEVSPVQVMPAYDESLQKAIDERGLVFSALRDYRFQSNQKAFLATMDHRNSALMTLNEMLIERQDLDAVMLYFEDLDALLHAYYKDSDRETDVVAFLERFDQKLGRLLTKIPETADLLVVGDHGMSAISYVLNSRKILGADIASKGLIAGGGGTLYFYPPKGALDQDPPSDLNLEAVAESLRQMDFDLTGAKLFGKVIVRGTPEAAAEGLTGKNLPWIMAFANDGVGFKNSVEDKLLLARAKWAEIPEALREKYPDPILNGKLQVPVPAGQHGHWNEIPQMRTRLVLEGPRLGQIDPARIQSMLELVPTVADAQKWERPSGCKAK